MDGFADSPTDGPGRKLQPTIDGDDIELVDVVAGELVEAEKAPALAAGERREAENLFAAGERIAARAASAGTRRQYAAIHRRFGDWLTQALGRPATVADLDADAIAAFARHLEAAGGRGGQPASLATRRVYLSVLRAFARQLGQEHAATETRVPRHRPGPPEVITRAEYANLLRVPDQRTIRGKRDVALLRVMGDCGLRAAEVRGLTAGALRRPRSNARHHRLYVRGKGGVEREVPVPSDTLEALRAWLAVHPLRRGVGLRDDEPVFVRLGRRGEQPPQPISAQGLHKLVNATCVAAGIERRLARPHMLRAYWATGLLDEGAPVHLVSARLGHADLRTTSRYAADRAEAVDDVADFLDRRHNMQRRWRRGDRLRSHERTTSSRRCAWTSSATCARSASSAFRRRSSRRGVWTA